MREARSYKVVTRSISAAGKDNETAVAWRILLDSVVGLTFSINPTVFF